MKQFTDTHIDHSDVNLEKSGSKFCIKPAKFVIISFSAQAMEKMVMQYSEIVGIADNRLNALSVLNELKKIMKEEYNLSMLMGKQYTGDKVLSEKYYGQAYGFAIALTNINEQIEKLGQ